MQRISDNDYYQNLSYSIKSEISYDKWNDAVTVLNHPVGFRKFSDLIVQCFDSSAVGIGTTQDKGTFSIQVDMISDVNLNCEYDFDLVIVGAGPAGSSAAFAASSQGVSVALLEKEKEILKNLTSFSLERSY